MAAPRFQLLSRPGCHLCEQMEDLLRSILPLHGEDFEVESVDSDPDWRERFGDVIPVLLRDGLPVAKISLDPQQLRRIVRGRRESRQEG